MDMRYFDTAALALDFLEAAATEQGVDFQKTFSPADLERLLQIHAVWDGGSLFVTIKIDWDLAYRHMQDSKPLDENTLNRAIRRLQEVKNSTTGHYTAALNEAIDALVRMREGTDA